MFAKLASTALIALLIAALAPLDASAQCAV